MKDTQQSRAGRAHERAERACPTLLYGDFEAAQLFIDSATRTRYFRNHFPRVADLGCIVKPLELNANASKFDWAWERNAVRRARFKTCLFPVLLVPQFALSQFILLHITAHAITGKEHGREWARTFLTLTAHCLGKKHAAALREAFKAEGVKYHKRPTYSDEQLAALRERGRKLQQAFREKTDAETGAGGA